MSAGSKRSEERTAPDDPAAAACALLAEVFSREVDEQMVGLLGIPSVAEVLTEAEPEVESLWSRPWDEVAAERHAVEFCRLFIRPGDCLPVADAWVRDVEAQQFSVRRWVGADEDSGADLPPHLEELPDNHVAKILGVRAGLAGAPRELVERFEEEMIRPWVAPFSNRLLATCELPVYRAVSRVLATLG